MKYPIGIQSFEKLRRGGFAYVDKTALLYKMADEGGTYFLSRPRRFGKSLTLSTFEAYFKGQKELFKGLAMETLEHDWHEHIVLSLSFGRGNYIKEGELDELLRRFLERTETKLGLKQMSSSLSERLYDIIEGAYEKSGRGVVVLVDEYDKPLLDVMDSQITVDVSGTKIPLEEYHRDTLRGFFSVLKDCDQYLRFVMITGITKFPQVSIFSGLNNLSDISLSDQYDSICGITQEEFEKDLQEGIIELSDAYSWTYDETIKRLKKQYDGYHFSERMVDVYNPFSLINALYNKKLRNYWFSTGSPSFLIRLMSRNKMTLESLAGKYYADDELNDYRANINNPLPIIFQSGYLTIKDYDNERNRYLLDLPNDEVKVGFIKLVSDDFFNASTDTESLANDMCYDLSHRNLAGVRDKLTSFLSSIPYTMRRKDDENEKERYFQYTFYLILRLLSTFVVDVELIQSQGRVDCVVKTNTDIFIFEFKLDGSADTALKQIEDKGYAKPFENCGMPIYKIGVNFSSKTGTIADWKEVLPY